MRPSDERRRALTEDLQKLPTVSNFFPIARYYDAADVLYESIQLTKNDITQLDLCYVYGKRYCHFVLDSIPTHNYYGIASQRIQQNKHTQQVELVVQILTKVVDQMDQEEIARQKAIEYDHEQRLREWQQHQQQIQQQIQQQSHNNNNSKIDVASSALDKLKKLQGIITEPPPPVPQQQQRPSSTRFRLDDSSSDSDTNECVDTINGIAVNPTGVSVLLPPPLLPPSSTSTSSSSSTSLVPPPALPPPPPYAAVVGKYHPLKVSQPLAPIDTNKPRQQSLSDQRAHYGRLYRDCINAGRITVTPLSTYQGRRSSSTNGCTVISALSVAAHLNHPNGANITNDIIERIIDEMCGPVLKTIRNKLGLGGHALIIPSDVHDHLVDHHILHQDKFRGAAGGNVLDPIHYGELIKLLTDDEPTPTNKNGRRPTKAGATFFFREHVISIVKCVDQTHNGVSYDFIDSMPSSGWNGRATRTTCHDPQALTIQLLQYVTNKLPDTNATNAPWDDGMADLDPRVFQGFVWGD